MANEFFNQFLAKSDGTTLAEHSHHVITAGNNLIVNLPFSPAEKKLWMEKLFQCAVLHDFGKIHPLFQKRLKGDRDVSIRHEIVSIWLCENYLNLTDDVLFAIATHHKGVISHLDADKRLELYNLQDEMQDLCLLAPKLLTKKNIADWNHLMCLEIPTKELNTENHQISKKTIKILWENYQIDSLPDFEDRKKLSLMRALLIAADHIGSARLENEIPKYKSILINDFAPRDKSGNILAFRNFQDQLRHIKTDVILHAPTGSGKTEAALNWVFANQKENTRLFYVLPYTASINAMVRRLQKIYNNDIVTALHSKTLDFFYQQLADESSNVDINYIEISQAAKKKKNLSSEIFYPVKVATLHQILKTSLKGKGWEFSLFDYKDALFIIDEFHTYDALLTGLMLASIKLFKRLFNAKFFFMSATIPEFMLNKIMTEVFDGDHTNLIRPNPDVISDAEILNRKRHLLKCKPKQSIQDAIPQIKEYLKAGKSVLIVVNNVKTCQNLYNEIAFEGSKRLLHSGFNRKSRIEIEKEITNDDISKRPQLLIATQAVEVSLDIDYNVAFIENAPIDALIQRFGRVNRAGKLKNKNGETILAPIYIYENILGKTPFYDDEVLNNTWSFLLELNNQSLSESDLVRVCNFVYNNGYTEAQEKDFEKGLNNSIIKNFEENWIAGHWYDWIEDAIESDNKKVEILCGNLVDEYDYFIHEKRYIEASQLLVSVYFYQIHNTSKVFDKKRNVIVAYDFVYDENIGFKLNKEDIFL